LCAQRLLHLDQWQMLNITMTISIIIRKPICHFKRGFVQRTLEYVQSGNTKSIRSSYCCLLNIMFYWFFFILQPNRTYYLEDKKLGSQEWVLKVEWEWKLDFYWPNFQTKRSWRPLVSLNLLERYLALDIHRDPPPQFVFQYESWYLTPCCGLEVHYPT
jgi:hypothetical protein